MTEIALPKEWTDKYPYIISVNGSPFRTESDSFQKWLRRNITDNAWAMRGIQGRYRICFKREEDAIWFALHWT